MLVCIHVALCQQPNTIRLGTVRWRLSIWHLRLYTTFDAGSDHFDDNDQSGV